MTTTLAGQKRTTAHTASYLADFAACADHLTGAGVPWLRELRRTAIDRFATLGFPTTRHENWRYTNVAPLARTGFHRASPDAGPPPSSMLPRFGPFVGRSITRLVFVNGRLSPVHSQIGDLPAGTQVTSLRRAIESEPELIEPYFARYATYDDHAFTALNTAFAEDGAFILLPEASALDRAIHILYISTPPSAPTVVHPRNLIVAGAGSRASIIEHYIGVDGANGFGYFNNVVTEIVAGEGARIDHYKLQQESDSAYHIAKLQIDQKRDSTVSSHSIALGARLSRYKMATLLGAEGADCSLYGLYLLDGAEHCDHYTFVDHARPRCTSRQLFKGIMNGSSRGVFTGRVAVRQHAQRTSAEQSNRNLLLSDRALVESRPQLEIYADDVRCTHGTAVGRLDEDMIFYLRTRGIGERDARALLTYAFASEVLNTIRFKNFRAILEEIFLQWLPAGRIIGVSDASHGPEPCG